MRFIIVFKFIFYFRNNVFINKTDLKNHISKYFIKYKLIIFFKYNLIIITLIFK